MKCNVRQAYVEALIQQAEKNERIVALDADSQEPTKIGFFASRFPNRSFNFGIAEQNMVTASAGMATEGLIPFVNTFAAFISYRALDQVRNSVAYPNLNVKLVVSHCGLDVGSDGVTHQTIEDVSIMRSIPNMAILVPADDIEVIQMVDFICNHNGPIYLRTGKSTVPRVHDSKFQFSFGTPQVLMDGVDITIFSYGIMVSYALQAAEKLKLAGIHAKVVNVSTLKPLNENLIVDYSNQTGAVVTVEDHNVMGGLGSIISEILARKNPLPMTMVGVPDQFAEAGSSKELYQKYLMDSTGISAAVKRCLKRKL